MHKFFVRKSLIWLLALMCIGQCFWMLLQHEKLPELTRIVQRFPLDNNGMLYVVVSNSGGATVPFIYQYYVHKRIDNDELALEALASKGHPFLMTRDHDAKVSASGKLIKVSVRKKIYRFSSPAILKVDNEVIPIDVWLDAQTDSSYLSSRSVP